MTTKTTTYRKLFELFGTFKSLNGVEETSIVDGKPVKRFTAFDLDCAAIVAVARNMAIIHAHIDTFHSGRDELATHFSGKDDPETRAKFSAAVESLLGSEIEMPRLHKIRLSGLQPNRNPKLQVGILSDLIRAGHVVDDMPVETEEAK